MNNIQSNFLTLRCPITLQKLTKIDQLVRTNCGHYFERSAFADWLKVSQYCPLHLKDKISLVETVVLTGPQTPQSNFIEIVNENQKSRKILEKIQRLPLEIFREEHLEILSNKRCFLGVKYLVRHHVKPTEELILKALEDKSLCKALSVSKDLLILINDKKKIKQLKTFTELETQEEALRFIKGINSVELHSEFHIHAMKKAWKGVVRYLNMHSSH